MIIMIEKIKASIDDEFLGHLIKIDEALKYIKDGNDEIEETVIENIDMAYKRLCEKIKIPTVEESIVYKLGQFQVDKKEGNMSNILENMIGIALRNLGDELKSRNYRLKDDLYALVGPNLNAVQQLIQFSRNYIELQKN